MLAGAIPVHLRIKYNNMRGSRGKSEKSSGESRENERKRLRDDIVALWQSEWDEFDEANWTKRLIPDIKEWPNRNDKANIDYHLAQLLTGHGVFNEYRVRIGKTDDPACWDCGHVADNTEHVLLACPRWNNERATLEEALGAGVNLQLVRRACKSSRTWTAFRNYARTTMGARIQKENEIQKQERMRDGATSLRRRREH